MFPFHYAVLVGHDDRVRAKRARISGSRIRRATNRTLED